MVFGRSGSGVIIDKMGICKAYQGMAITTIINTICFMSIRSNFYAFCTIMSINYGLYASFTTLRTLSPILLYDVNLGMKMQGSMEIISGLGAIIIWIFDVAIISNFGYFNLSLIIIGINLAILMNVHKFDWMEK